MPAEEIDPLVIDRLRQFIEADITIATKVKQYLEEVLVRQAQNRISIDDQLAEIKRKLAVARRRLSILNKELSGTPEDDDLVVSLTKTVNALSNQQSQLLKQKNLKGSVRGPQEVKKFYSVLMHFDEQWPQMNLEAKPRLTDVLVMRIEMDTLSPHWFTHPNPLAGCCNTAHR